MADDIAISQGSGAKVVASKDIGGRQFQEVLIAGTSGGGQGSKTSTTPATPVQVSSSSVSCRNVWITGFEGNSDFVVIGFSSAVRAGATGGLPSGTRTGIQIAPSQTVQIPVNNLNLLYLDVITSGDGVHYGYIS